MKHCCHELVLMNSSRGSQHSLKEMSKMNSFPSGLVEGCSVLSKLSLSELQERVDCIHLVWWVSYAIQIMGTGSHLHLKVRKTCVVLGQQYSSG